jgi:hypothetical protein
VDEERGEWVFRELYGVGIQVSGSPFPHNLGEGVS